MSEEAKIKSDKILYIGPIREMREESNLEGDKYVGLSGLCVTRVGGKVTGKNGEWHFEFPKTRLSSIDIETKWQEEGKSNVWISLSYPDIPEFPGDIYLLSFVIPTDGSPSYFHAGIEG